jgi:cell division topological specificity factor
MTPDDKRGITMGFFRKLIGRGGTSSSDVAKRRLQLVLVHDRSNISPGLMAVIRDEIINVISRHIDIDRNGVEINFSQQGRESRLVADIPLSDPRTGSVGRE